MLRANDLAKLEAFHREHKVPLTVTVYERSHSEVKKNNVLVDNDGFVTVYDKKRETPGLNGVDIGFFILSKDVLDLAPESNFSFEREILPRLAAAKQLDRKSVV